jgi:hypothetical protein
LSVTAGTEPGANVRRACYALLLTVAASVIGARLLAPLSFSVNDISRWATIRALVETGSYSLGRRYPLPDGTHQDRGFVAETGWKTVDVVMNPNTGRFYSSKPALLPTVLAGEYWVLRHGLDWRIARERGLVSRTILFTINWLPFLIYLVLFARLVERLGTTDWGRLFVFSTACFGTFVSGFLATLNNHTVAASGALFALYQCLRIHLDNDRRWWRFLLAGLTAGWTACNELPAVALAAGLMAWLLFLSRRDTLRFALPGVLLPVAAYLYIQYEVFGSVVPTYAREELYQFAGASLENPIGIDAANEGKLLYAFNFLAGHTGILSLTPALLLGWIGMVRTAAVDRGERADVAARQVRHVLAWLTLALTIVTFAFYVGRTNNYGGGTSGPRWFFWLVPLWLLTMLPEADRWGRERWKRGLAYLLLAVSVGSATYSLANPWRHSWLFTLLEDWNIISYY